MSVVMVEEVIVIFVPEALVNCICVAVMLAELETFARLEPPTTCRYRRQRDSSKTHGCLELRYREIR